MVSMNHHATGIPVFQDLVISGPDSLRDSMETALKDIAAPPWHYNAERTQFAAQEAYPGDRVLIFEREQADERPAGGLVLLSQAGGYYVPNIVPTKERELSIGQYNAILSDFAERVAKPAARRNGFSVTMTGSREALEDWLPEPAAEALRSFSAAANKSTHANHPSDQRRWFDFILATFRAGRHLDSGYLARWLNEVDGWDERSAHELAGEYGRMTDLLNREAETR